MKAQQHTRKPRPPARAAERIKGEAVTPTNLLRLIEAVGPSRASRDLGVSTTTLHKARKANLVSKSIEVAARAVLRDIGEEMASMLPEAPKAAGKRRETTMFMLEVEPHQADVVEKMADMLHAKLLRA